MPVIKVKTTPNGYGDATPTTLAAGTFGIKGGVLYYGGNGYQGESLENVTNQPIAVYSHYNQPPSVNWHMVRLSYVHGVTTTTSPTHTNYYDLFSVGFLLPIPEKATKNGPRTIKMGDNGFTLVTANKLTPGYRIFIPAGGIGFNNSIGNAEGMHVCSAYLTNTGLTLCGPDITRTDGSSPSAQMMGQAECSYTGSDLTKFKNGSDQGAQDMYAYCNTNNKWYYGTSNIQLDVSYVLNDS